METPSSATKQRFDTHEVRELAAQLRVDSIRCSTSVGSGHPTSSLSAADLMAVLLSWHLRYDWRDPKVATNDHLIFSKGHASPLLYSIYKAAGAISDEELVGSYRRLGSRLQGHPTPALPWVDVATGSLGQGLPAAVGIALAGKYLDKLDYRVWVLCGDGEMTEGSVWEAIDKAAHYGLDNLTVIIDVNRLGQTGPTELQWDTGAYARRVGAFGCLPLEIDGHHLDQIDAAYSQAATAGRPTVILARTVKGKGVPLVEDRNGWHGKALPADVAAEAIQALGGERNMRVALAPREPKASAVTPDPEAHVTLPRYEIGEMVATRKAYGDALTALGARPEIVVLDGEVGNSTFSEEFRKAHPERSFEMYISEQLMIGAAVGFSARGYIPFASTFAAFLSRAYDFIRMAAVSRADIRICGSHAGVEIGADGPSQMGLEDIAALRSVQDSTVLYPSDATSTAALVKQMADREGIVYMRTTRGAYPVLYASDEAFPIGSLRIARSSMNDQVVLLGAGITVHSSLEAARSLQEDGIQARVVDLYTVKPLDVEALRMAVRAVDGRLVITEDHHPEGGIGEAVVAALVEAGETLFVRRLAVQQLPGSGTPAELMDVSGISAAHIVRAARELLEERDRREDGQFLAEEDSGA